MTPRAKKATDAAVLSSQRLAKFAHAMSEDLDDNTESSGIPMRPSSSEDSMVHALEDVVAAQRRVKHTTEAPVNKKP